MAWSDLVSEERVHRRVYTDPEVFDTEMTKVFGAVWTYLAHESEVPEPNDFKLASLGTRPIIVTRSADGEIHALFNRCTHRGATICREAYGNSRTFVCGYHGWTYQNTGRVLGMPGQKAYGPDLDKPSYNLSAPYSVETYRGFIFATLNPDPPDLITYLGNARELIDEWIDGQSETGDFRLRTSAHRFTYAGNWKLAYDNAADGYHVPYSHRSLLQMTTERYGGGDMEYFANADASKMTTAYLGNGHTFVDQRPEMYEVSAWRQQRPQPGREAYETQLRSKFGDESAESLLEFAVGSGMNLNIFPNLLLIGNQVQVIEPVAHNKTILHWYATTSDSLPSEINIMRVRSQEDFPILGEVDDNANFEGCQIGLGIPEIEWVDITRHLHTGEEETLPNGVVQGPVTSDVHLRGFYRYWAQLMDADFVAAARRTQT